MYIQRRKVKMKKRYYGDDTYEREEICTNEKQYTSIYVGIWHESLKKANKNEKNIIK